jgi:hypothetical protein
MAPKTLGLSKRAGHHQSTLPRRETRAMLRPWPMAP